MKDWGVTFPPVNKSPQHYADWTNWNSHYGQGMPCTVLGPGYYPFGNPSPGWEGLHWWVHTWSWGWVSLTQTLLSGVNECRGGKPNNAHYLCQQRTLSHRRLKWQPILRSFIWLIVFKSLYSNIVLSAPQGTHVPQQIWALYWIHIWLRLRNNPISFPSPHRGLITNPLL